MKNKILDLANRNSKICDSCGKFVEGSILWLSKTNNSRRLCESCYKSLNVNWKTIKSVGSVSR